MTTIAVIGCGRISEGAHFPAFAQMDNIRVKYACDLIESKAAEKKEKYPFVEQVITDYHVALNDPEVDAVWVLTPNYVHYTVTMDAPQCREACLLRKADNRQLRALGRDGEQGKGGRQAPQHRSLQPLSEVG